VTDGGGDNSQLGDSLGYDDIDVDLTPGIGLLGALKGLRYNEWFALAEYVDNSLSSYLRDIDRIKAVHRNGVAPPLQVSVKQSPDRLIIRDNAGGIAKTDLQRALRAGTPPPANGSKFNLYGIGMKAASIWWGDRFVIQTTQPGDPVGRLIDVDLRQVLANEQGSVKVSLFRADPADHYTVIGLSSLRKPIIAGRTVQKVREFLASIYREYIDDRVLRLDVLDEEVSYSRPKPLRAKPFERAGHIRPGSEEIEWFKPIDVSFELDDGTEAAASGWAMVRAKGSTANAGFALLQNRRVIEGAVEPWRPTAIAGPPNKHRYQRLQGQLEIAGVLPEITKTNFRWSDAEVERFLKVLREALDEEPIPLLKQADNFRQVAKDEPKDRPMDTETAAKEAVAATAEAVSRAEQDVMRLLDSPSPERPHSLNGTSAYEETRMVHLGRQEYEVHIELVDGGAVDDDWLTVTHEQGSESDRGVLRIGINRDCLFMEVFEGATGEAIKPIVRVAAAIAVSETAARAGGAAQAPLIRQYVNELLRGELGTD
jgi:hypothetical protein